MTGDTEKSGKNNLKVKKNITGTVLFAQIHGQNRGTTFHYGKKFMTAFVFIFVYYLGRPIFVNFGVSDRYRFFTALALGLILETAVFAITGTSGYKMIN
jgi:hypothetical protein